MSECYNLENSPLYRLRNRRKLAEYLGLPCNYFSKQHDYLYDKFSKPKQSGNGKRDFCVPRDEIYDIQRQICKLLRRIKTSQWVKSGKKGCCYITNAEEHLGYRFVKTMDISKFYDSVQRGKIYNLFFKTFNMEHDIAWIMTNLVMCDGILPTGSPTSQLIVYWAYYDMFEEIYRISEEMGCHFSLYVDDMTFSSNEPISSELRKKVAWILRKNGLYAKIQKDHYYQADRFKIITGVGLKHGTKVVLNSKRKKAMDLYKQCKENPNIHDIEKLNGMLCSLRQIEPDIFPEIYVYVRHFDGDLKRLARNRFYAMKRRCARERRNRELEVQNA